MLVSNYTNRHIIGNDLLYQTIQSLRGPKTSQKSKSNLKIPGARSVTWSKFHTEQPQILGTTLQQLNDPHNLALKFCAPMPSHLTLKIFTKHYSFPSNFGHDCEVCCQLSNHSFNCTLTDVNMRTMKPLQLTIKISWLVSNKLNINEDNRRKPYPCTWDHGDSGRYS